MPDQPGRDQAAALPAIRDEEITAIQEAGRRAIARHESTRALAKQIAGMEWGDVRGANLTRATQYAMAVFCEVTRANPMIHLDVLGGRPYLNAHYWRDRINDHPLYHDHSQRNISPAAEQAQRDKAGQLRALAADLPDGERKTALIEQAVEADLDAIEIAELRAHYQVPEWATHAYETTIIRYSNQAPIALIRSGAISDPAPLEGYRIEVREANWAGGRPRKPKRGGGEYQPDPVGEDEPAKTARSRSLRRAAISSFPAWMDNYAPQVAAAEEALQADFELLTNGEPEGGEVEIGEGGEPEAAAAGEPRELPGTVEPAPKPEPPAEEEKWDRADAHRRLFATLHDAGISEDGRKVWAAENDLPPSTTNWGRAEYERAHEILMRPAIAKYNDGCEVLGYDPVAFAQEKIGQQPEYLRHFNALNAELERQAAAADR